LPVGRNLRIANKLKRKIILGRDAGLRLRLGECGAENQEKRENTLHESHHSESHESDVAQAYGLQHG